MSHLKESFHHPNLHIGMRNVKTALVATLCALIYFPFNRNPTFACIGAVFVMGYDMENSQLHGGNRLFDTAIGGFLGMVLFRIYIIFYPTGEKHAIILLLLFIGVVTLILIIQNVWPGAVQPEALFYVLYYLIPPLILIFLIHLIVFLILVLVL